MAIGENLKHICKMRGMTLKELSKKSGVPVGTIYSITLRDPASVNSETMRALCGALEVDSDKLRMDPEDYKAHMKQIDDYIRQHENEPKPERQHLSVILPEGVYLVEDHEPYPGLYGYGEVIQIIYPDGAIDITQEEMDGLKENIRRYVAFTLENFKQDHEDRLIEKEDLKV